MKTIKEKQTEYVMEHTAETESYEAYAEKEDIAAAYEAGANYILEEIEKFMKLYSTCINAYDLKSVIEQLRK